MPSRTRAKLWMTVCLHETALNLSEDELRVELSRWLPCKLWLPGVERGRLAPSHPYALFVFVPAEYHPHVMACRRSRLVEQVIVEPVKDGELRRSLTRVGQVKPGAMVRVHEGALTGVEGKVVRSGKHSLLIRITLRSGDRTVWVRRWEITQL